MDAETLITSYKEQMKAAMDRHNALIDASKDDLQRVIDNANKELAEMAAALSGAKVTGGGEKESPPPETAWTNGHLVLNPQAVELLSKMFDAFNAIIPELQKLVKGR